MKTVHKKLVGALVITLLAGALSAHAQTVTPIEGTPTELPDYPITVPEGWSGLSSLWAFGLALASMSGLRLRRCRS
jgi:hypothetical protein